MATENLSLEEMLKLCEKVKSWKAAKRDHYRYDGWDVMGDRALIEEGDKYSIIGNIEGIQIKVSYNDQSYFLNITTPESRNIYSIKVKSEKGTVLGEHEDLSRQGNKVKEVYESLKFYSAWPRKELKNQTNPEKDSNDSIVKARKCIPGIEYLKISNPMFSLDEMLEFCKNVEYWRRLPMQEYKEYNCNSKGEETLNKQGSRYFYQGGLGEFKVLVTSDMHVLCLTGNTCKDQDIYSVRITSKDGTIVGMLEDSKMGSLNQIRELYCTLDSEFCWPSKIKDKAKSTEKSDYVKDEALQKARMIISG